MRIIKSLLLTAMALFIALFLVGCQSNEPDEPNGIVGELQAQIAALQEENEALRQAALPPTSNYSVPVNDSAYELEDEPAYEPTPIIEPEPYVVVTFTGMTSIPRDTSARRFSDRVEFQISALNNTDRYIRGIQGVVDIQDMFGVSIWRIGADLVGHTISPDGTAQFDGLGVDINQFIDREVRVFTTAFEDLVFIYEVSQVIFAD